MCKDSKRWVCSQTIYTPKFSCFEGMAWCVLMDSFSICSKSVFHDQTLLSRLPQTRRVINQLHTFMTDMFLISQLLKSNKVEFYVHNVHQKSLLWCLRLYKHSKTTCLNTTTFTQTHMMTRYKNSSALGDRVGHLHK